MKIISFNINSVRARPHQLEYIRDHLDPDVIGLQETKVHDDEFPEELINDIGYHCEFWGQKGHYGVALLSKKKPIEVFKGFAKDTEDDQKRFIQGKYKFNSNEIYILNGYFPQGENRNHEIKFPKKIKYYKDLKQHIKKLKRSSSNIIVMGDFNVAPTENDIGIGEVNAKDGFAKVNVHFYLKKLRCGIQSKILDSLIVGEIKIQKKIQYILGSIIDQGCLMTIQKEV